MLTSFRVCIMKDLFLLSISHVISYNSTMTTHVDIFQSLYNEGPVPSVHLSCYILAYEKYLKELAIYQVLWSKYNYLNFQDIKYSSTDKFVLKSLYLTPTLVKTLCIILKYDCLRVTVTNSVSYSIGRTCQKKKFTQLDNSESDQSSQVPL